MILIEILKAIFFGIVEGITEWLPISSTGHLIIIEKIVHMNMTSQFYSLFQVVIQLAAVLAVVVIFFKKLWPLQFGTLGNVELKPNAFNLWKNIIISCIPAVIIGLLFDDLIDKHFYNYIVVSISLIVVGIVFIVLEDKIKDKTMKIYKINSITPKIALYIGLFQVLAAIFPGTSRSGATIIGALILGVSRSVACEYTFYLAVPVMAGASLLKILKYLFNFGFDIKSEEVLLLLVSCITAFLVSIFVIKGLMNFVKKHDFKSFGYYRIVLGAIVLITFGIMF